MANIPRISNFYEKHYAKYLVIAIGLQIGLMVLLCGGAYLLYIADILRGGALIVLAGAIFLVVQSGIIVFTLRLYGRPFKIISDAVAHVSDQPGDTPPPNVNNPIYERSGLKALVQTIYKLSAASMQTPDEKAVETGLCSTLKAIFSKLPCEMIVLDNNSNVTFYHGSGGLKQTANGAMEIKLRFGAEDNLQTWLQQSRQNKLRDDNQWKRIPNAVLGSDETRKIYDVIAHYEKNDNPQIETILLLIDRTADYSEAEESMDYIALAAHELRGPITVIRGYLDVLNEEMGSEMHPNTKQLLDRMKVSSERLSGYINNILNVSKYDRAHLKLHLKQENLSGILKNLMNDVILRARTQNRHLLFKIPEGLPPIAADASSLSEVIINLIDNAIKYSREGGKVTVGASAESDFVQLTVEDHGIGMPDNVVGNLFTKFYRSHRSSQTVVGTGLGLYISKAIVESHGGKIWARSTEGKGSTFGIMIPTYASVAEKLKSGDNSNENVIKGNHGWIKNHSMYRG